MGNGFGEFETAYIIITDSGELLKDRSSYSYGFEHKESRRKYNEEDYKNRVEISDYYDLSSSNGSTVYTVRKIQIKIYIDGSLFFKESVIQNERDPNNNLNDKDPMWKLPFGENLLESFLERLQVNTFEHPLFKVCKDVSEEQIRDYFYTLLLKIKENPEKYSKEKFNIEEA